MYEALEPRGDKPERGAPFRAGGRVVAVAQRK
jgi:hypothetical protein